MAPADIEQGGYAVAIHASDDEDAEVVACGVLQGTVPFVADLAEVGGSGVEGHVVVEADDDGISLTTGAFETSAAN